MAHRVADYHPTVKPETIRLMERKPASLCSRGNPRPFDDGPPLVVYRVPESSDLLGHRHTGMQAFNQLFPLSNEGKVQPSKYGTTTSTEYRSYFC